MEGYIHCLHGESASDYPWSCILIVRDWSPASCLKYESMEKYRESMGLLHGGWELMLVNNTGKILTKNVLKNVWCGYMTLSFFSADYKISFDWNFQGSLSMHTLYVLCICVCINRWVWEIMSMCSDEFLSVWHLI